MPGSKICNRCLVSKSKLDFGRNAKGKDGLDPSCRQCHCLRAKEKREQNKKHPEIKECGQKTCSCCKRSLPIQSFQLDRGRSDGRQYSCRECMTKMQRIRQAKRTATYQAPVGSKVCPKCKQTLSISSFTVEKGRADGVAHVCKKCKSERRQVLRLEVMAHYCEGEPSCACCGENHPYFLSIDHINGGGGKHRASISDTNFYRFLKREGYPEGYRILCHNCNQAFGYYGYCPHQKEKGH